MIPKIIHFCWFGRGAKNEVILQCIDSWKKHLPEYEIYEWNEDTFDVTSNKFVNEAYEARKWAFITDYVRLHALKEYGGVYLDSDVEILSGLDIFLKHRAFSGFEDNNLIPTGIMAAEKEHPWIIKLLEYYSNRGFVKSDGKYDMRPNTKVISEISSKHFGYDSQGSDCNTHIVLKDDVNIYPWYVFCPKRHLDGYIDLREETVAIHHFNGSWLSKKDKCIKTLVKLLVKIFGARIYNQIRDIYRKVSNKEKYD